MIFSYENLARAVNVPNRVRPNVLTVRLWRSHGKPHSSEINGVGRRSPPSAPRHIPLRHLVRWTHASADERMSRTRPRGDQPIEPPVFWIIRRRTLRVVT